MQIISKPKGGKTKQSFFIFLVLFLCGGGAYGFITFFENEKPIIAMSDNLDFLGKNTPILITTEDKKSGIQSLKLSILQKDKEFVLLQKSFPRNTYIGQVGPAELKEEAQFIFKDSGLSDGTAEIIAVARDFSLRGFFSGNITEIRKMITIDTQPPKLRLVHAEGYISPGGSGIVIYQIPETVPLHGVHFNGQFFKGYPVGNDRENLYIAYIALPYDAESIAESDITAQDYAGNLTSVPFATIFKRAIQKHDTINLSDAFLNLKIPEFEQHYPQMSGNMEEKYLFTNREVRLQNNAKIAELCQNPTHERLWQGRFQRMAGSSQAGYADHRTYFYNGKEIDRQVHLGMDIASTQQAEVKAANKGRVVFADYLGIYGNMVILDHGQGVFSLYSHLSHIQVAQGDLIDSNLVLGLTGTSGMAGGDHLHFSMLIGGIFVTPKEWWDQQWIDVTIENPLADARF